MRRVKRVALKRLTIEELLQGFVIAAAGANIEAGATYVALTTHEENLERYADEFGRRDRLRELERFLDSPDAWLAYVSAKELSQFDETKHLGLVTLDRLADSDNGELVPSLAHIARNAARHSDPRRPFEPPTEEQRIFLRVVTRGYPIAEAQIERCLISRWNNGNLGVRVLDGAAPISDGGPLRGPTAVTGRDDFAVLESLLWFNDRGMLVSIMLEPYDGKIIPDPMSYFVDAGQANLTRLQYPNPSP